MVLRFLCLICGKIQHTLKVYRSLAEFNTLECAVATTGTFDGVHLGHQKILNQLMQTAKKVGGESVLLTFDPHPRVVLQPDVELKLLSSIEEKNRTP
jgi:riboflavin kinase/FMN adenylyltransferase